jgi:hypothetical protein
MLSMRPWYTTLLIAVAFSGSGCGGDTSARILAPPDTAPSLRNDGASRDGPDVRGELLRSCAAVPSQSVSREVGRTGGMIVVGGNVLVVPPGALLHPVTITAQIRSDFSGNMVIFHPDGLKFHTPVILTMDYSHCDVPNGRRLRIAQVSDDLAIIQQLKSADNRRHRIVVGELHHFSNYAVAW